MSPELRTHGPEERGHASAMRIVLPDLIHELRKELGEELRKVGRREDGLEMRLAVRIAELLAARPAGVEDRVGWDVIGHRLSVCERAERKNEQAGEQGSHSSSVNYRGK